MGGERQKWKKICLTNGRPRHTFLCIFMEYISFVKPIELWGHVVLGVKKDSLIFSSFIGDTIIESPIRTIEKGTLSLRQIESLLLAIDSLYKTKELTMEELLSLQQIEKQICDKIPGAASKSGMNEGQMKTIEYCLSLFSGSNLDQNITRIRLFLMAELILSQKI